MIDDRFAPAIETVAGLAPAAATNGPAPRGGDALFDDDRLAASPPPRDQHGSPPGSTTPSALAVAARSISEADMGYWFG